MAQACCSSSSSRRFYAPLPPPLAAAHRAIPVPPTRAGHGGIHAAEFVKANLYNTLLAHPKFPADPVAATVESYEAIDAQYCSLGANRDDGCTAVTALVQGSRLIVANVGDSRAILCRAGRAIQLSIDHKPNAKEERQRVERAGGVVVWAGTWRVGGVLAVSRAFGDKPLKRYVTGTPDVKDERLTPEDEFLILASDGLWDSLSVQEAADVAQEALSRAWATAAPPAAAARIAAQVLTRVALHRGSLDNVTALVVLLPGGVPAAVAAAAAVGPAPPLPAAAAPPAATAAASAGTGGARATVASSSVSDSQQGGVEISSLARLVSI